MSFQVSIPGNILSSLITEPNYVKYGILLGNVYTSSEIIITDSSESSVQSIHVHTQEYIASDNKLSAESWHRNNEIGIFILRQGDNNLQQPTFQECILAHSISKQYNRPAIMLIINAPSNQGHWVYTTKCTCYIIESSISKIPKAIDFLVPNLNTNAIEGYQGSSYLNESYQFKNSHRQQLHDVVIASSIQQTVLLEYYAHNIVDELKVVCIIVLKSHEYLLSYDDCRR
jgi:hypothetical protein